RRTRRAVRACSPSFALPDLRQREHHEDGVREPDHDGRERDVRRLQHQEQHRERRPKQREHEDLLERVLRQDDGERDPPDEQHRHDLDRGHRCTVSLSEGRQSPSSRIRAARAVACVSTGWNTSRNTATSSAITPEWSRASLAQIAPAASHGATDEAGARKCSRSYTCGMSRTPSTETACSSTAPPRRTATATSTATSYPPFDEPREREGCHEGGHGVHEGEVEVDRPVEPL